MKKFIAVFAAIVLLAALGVTAYKFGWLAKVGLSTAEGPGTAAPGGSSGGGVVTSDASLGTAFGDQPGASPAAPVAPVAIAQAGQPVANKAIELRVTNLRTAPSLGGRTADASREFVIVDTAWKNLLQPQRVNRKAAEDRTAGAGGLGFGGGTDAKQRAEDEANTTLESVRFQVGPMTNHVWLLIDGRFAETIDVDATDTIDGHLPTDQLEIARFQEVRSGSLAFQAPANAGSLSLLFLDSEHGHMLLAIKGAPPRLASSLGGSSRANEIVVRAPRAAGRQRAGAGRSVCAARGIAISRRRLRRREPAGRTGSGAAGRPSVLARGWCRTGIRAGRRQCRSSLPADRGGSGAGGRLAAVLAALRRPRRAVAERPVPRVRDQRHVEGEVT
jgi:hypothetical protein